MTSENDGSSSYKTLTFITTNECSARCSHCLMLSGPKRHEKMSFGFLQEQIESHSHDPLLQAVIFTGGEATRLGDDLLEAVAFASSKGLSTRLVTNAEWAGTEEATKRKLIQLLESGLRELNISCDDFHAEWIPFDNVKRIWRIATDMPFTALVLGTCSCSTSEITPDSLRAALGEDIPDIYDEDGKERTEFRQTENRPRKLISNHHINRLGRARSLNDRYFTTLSTQKVENFVCPASNRQPTYGPSGHLWTCCGINAEGNVVLDRSVHSSDCSETLRDTILDAIGTFGPGYLMSLIKQGDPSARFSSHYSSICEICFDVTRSRRNLHTLASLGDKISSDVTSWRLVERQLQLDAVH